MEKTAFPKAQMASFSRDLWRQMRRRDAKRDLIVAAASDHPVAVEAIQSGAIDARGDLFVCNLEQARKIIGRTLRHAATELEEPLPRPSRNVGAPSQVIRANARPAVLPGLVPRQPAEPSSAAFSAVLSELTTILHSDRTGFAILDWLQGRSGLAWKDAAAILEAHGLPLDCTTQEMARTAREFWQQLKRFSDVFRNAVQLRQVEPAEGEWAYVEADEVSWWLPGIRIPKMHFRGGYLVRASSRGGSLLYLDFYSLSYCPLFRVPV